MNSSDKTDLHYQFAAAALAGLLARGGSFPVRGTARAALEHADALLTEYAERDKRQPLTSDFLRLLNEWRDQYFKANPEARHWEGTSFQLQKQIMANPQNHDALRQYDVNAITRELLAHSKRGYPVEAIDTDRESSFRWRLFPSQKHA